MLRLEAQEGFQNFQVDLEISVAVVGQLHIYGGDALRRDPVHELARVDAAGVQRGIAVVAGRSQAFRQADGGRVGWIAAGEDSQPGGVIADQRLDSSVRSDEGHQSLRLWLGGGYQASGERAFLPAAGAAVVLLPVGREVTVQVDPVGVTAAIGSSTRFAIGVQAAQDEEGLIDRDGLWVGLQVGDQLIRECNGVPLIPAMDAGDDHQQVMASPKPIYLQRVAFYRSSDDEWVGQQGRGGGGLALGGWRGGNRFVSRAVGCGRRGVCQERREPA